METLVAALINKPSNNVPQSLKALNGRTLEPYSLHLTRCETLARRNGWRRIALSLTDEEGRQPHRPLVQGFYCVGGSSRGSWIDCDPISLQVFDHGEKNLAGEGVALADRIPPWSLEDGP